MWGAVNGGAAAVGPILGGLLTEQFGWCAIFLVNLPVAAIAVFMSLRVLGDAPHRGRRRIDVPGAVAFTACAAAVTYALIQSNTDGWGSATVLGLFGVAAVALIAFVAIEMRTADPLPELKLLRNPSFAGLMVAGGLLSAGAFAHLTYTSIWLQSVLGMSPIKAGLAVSPLALTAFVVAGFGGKHLGRFAPQWPIGLGLVLIGVGTLLLMLVGGGSSWTALVPGLMVAGVGVGMATPVLTSAAMSAVPHERAGMAGGALNTFRQLGYASASPCSARSSPRPPRLPRVRGSATQSPPASTTSSPSREARDWSLPQPSSSSSGDPRTRPGDPAARRNAGRTAPARRIRAGAVLPDAGPCD